MRGGYGIRLDAGNAFVNAVISPYYDSLLVKVTSWARSFNDAVNKAKRALKEMKVTGVKTNRAFLLNVLNHPTFRAGNCDTGFIADNPELFNIMVREDKELKVLTYLGEKFVNGNRGIKPQFDVPVFPRLKPEETAGLSGTKQILDEKGPEGLVDWVKDQKKLLITDTTMRDAQQSLMATRVRTVDMERSHLLYLCTDRTSSRSKCGAEQRSIHRTDSSRNRRGRDLKRSGKRSLNIMFQMLLRGATA